MASRPLWTPPADRVARSQLQGFLGFLSKTRGLEFADYAALHRWSVDELEDFWAAAWEFLGIRHVDPYRKILSDRAMPGAKWFEGTSLSFAENLLFSPQLKDSGQTAIIFESEDENRRREITFEELDEQVALCGAALHRLGVEEGDRVAALTPNVPEAVVAMLATSSLGAIWSSCSPDFGPQGILDRFGQIEPVVLFACDSYLYNGKRYALDDRLKSVLESVPSIRHVIVYTYAGPTDTVLRGQLAWDDFLETGRENRESRYSLFPFDQPIAILYTSGTTGAPKCLVHSAGGALLKHKEELMLQTDVQPGDVAFYFTTCGWMMWNWLVSALACGATIVLYDGSPVWPDMGRLFRLIDRNGITLFGTSARFLATVEKSGYRPRESNDLGSLRTITSTGSPLHAPQFEWIYHDLKQDVHVASISGGTDIVGCFVLGAPGLPVHAGEIQCRALGMDVHSFDDAGKARIGEKGELVCSAPFPSMPVSFWNDDGSRYRSAYFERYPGHWHHGDFIEFTERGSAIIHGRSDATLNPGGVRIGTAEIYRVVEQFDEVTDCIAVGLEEDGDTKILLYVVLANGHALDDALRDRLKKAIRSQTSPRHVPAEIHKITEVPRTISGKAVEIAISRVLQGLDPGNRDALANPEALDQFTKRV
jgi:acetoacetyl-CoA synthetase